MKKILSIAILLIMAICSKAEVWDVDNLPIAHLNDSSKWVCNPDGVLRPAVEDSLNIMLNSLYNKSGVESLVIVVKRIKNGDDPYTATMPFAKKYGVGNSQNSGLVVMLSTEDRSYQILTGTGLEGALPDATCKMIEEKQMVPSLKEGNYERAMVNAINAIGLEVTKDTTLFKDPANGAGDDDWMAGLVAAGLIGGGLWWGLRSKKKKCPACGKKEYEVTESKLISTDSNLRGYKHYDITYTCKACGHTNTERTKIRKSMDRGSIAGAAGAAGAAGTRSSSRSRGGSYGGGRFGGGGAGGRF